MPHSATLPKTSLSNTRASFPQAARPGLATRLTPRTVAEWEARLGVGSVPTRPRPDRFTGHSGTTAYSPTVDVRIAEPETFHAMRFAQSLSSIVTYCALQPAMTMERTAERVRNEPSDSLVVSVSGMRGQSLIRQNGREFVYGPGDLVFVSNATPYSLVTNAVADPSGLLIPFNRLGKHRHIAERLQRPIAANTPLARAAAVFVRRFAAETSALNAGQATGTVSEQAAVDLIVAALSELDGSPTGTEDNALFVQEAARDLIDRHHRDPSFSPDAIAERLHLSRRQLYRYFENCDTSLASRIADRRLQTAHEMLMQNAGASISTIALSSGFPTVATFRNRFKQRYGVGPVEYRHRVRG
ncbi:MULTISPECIES: helix-turn-helix domain-containing protein [Gordonia]|uniref:Helix-turn-helix domain-containing protein n=3 Tax=Gordonia TaxID=2053 RepID=A0ABP5UUN8_9ACTN|nr:MULTISPECIES: helix-turn-helix domain-containing protein [Gordonia]AUH67823.1 AraC family transcriptional regulator [Gordonia sp. YC-JH1]KJR06128.1 AraC family transcriptional regulator [Gordonia sihwensis]KXT58264.1 AraC family transcriptional regulator [Gordonia sp. QH-12]MBY4570842.1 AraC family transcriptional regulator [Gordonia sihwensis]GAC62574.1 putative AraC family transcriptional regulator [Gordonia sihwensis NBRC 108236]